MNREILFKAKRKDNGEWVEGSLITGVFLRGGKDIPYILCPDKADYDCFEDFNEENGIFEVDLETVCQYTNLTGRDGKIFEGDIVKGNVFGNFIVGTVVWLDIVACGFYLKHKNNYYPIGKDEHTGRSQDEVIGNIFDNPELLEEVE